MARMEVKVLNITIKKSMIFCVLLTLLAGALCHPAFASDVTAADKNINIALHKSVESHYANAERLTDGLYNETDFSGTAEAEDTFTVDLGRHVRISEIKLWPSQSGNAISGADVSNLAIELSNDKSDWITVDSWGDCSNASFTAADAQVAQPEAGTYGRYVRIRKTAAGSFSYGELQVFADVKALEVSRNKTVTANRESNIAPTAFTLSLSCSWYLRHKNASDLPRICS